MTKCLQATTPVHKIGDSAKLDVLCSFDQGLREPSAKIENCIAEAAGVSRPANNLVLGDKEEWREFTNKIREEAEKKEKFGKEERPWGRKLAEGLVDPAGKMKENAQKYSKFHEGFIPNSPTKLYLPTEKVSANT